MLTALWPKLAQCHRLYGRGLLISQWPAGTPELPPTLPTPSPSSSSWSCWRVWVLCWWPWAVFCGHLIPLEGPPDTFFFFPRNSSWGKAWTSWKTDILPFFPKKWVSHNLYDSLSVCTKKKLTPKFSSHLQSLCQLRNLLEFLFLLLYYKGFLFLKMS